MRKIILILVLLALPLVCFGQEATTTASPEYKKSIKDILAKAENLGSVQYETVSIEYNIDGSPAITVTAKTWQKLPYIKHERIMKKRWKGVPKGYRTEDKKSLMIAHPDSYYIYLAGKDKYWKQPLTIEKTRWISSILGWLDIIKNHINVDMKELGPEMLDGKLTTIVEFDYVEEGLTKRAKAWVWNEKGIPLKIEMTIINESKAVSFTIKEENKNFVFEDFPDGVFEVPKDKIVEGSPCP